MPDFMWRIILKLLSSILHENAFEMNLQGMAAEEICSDGVFIEALLFV